MAAEAGSVIACHTQEDFDTHFAKGKETGKLVIVDFTASWCGPCRVIAPVFAEFAKKFPGAIFLKVDVDEQKETAEKYQVEAMPTFLFFRDGEKVDTVVGGRKDEIHNKIVELSASISASSASA